MAKKSPGSITQRRNGLYQIDVTLVDGSRKTRYTRDYKEAQRILQEQLRKIEEGRLTSSKSVTLAEYLEYWLRVVEQSVRQRTYASYKLCVTRILSTSIHVGGRPCLIGSVKLDTLRVAHIQEAYMNLLGGWQEQRALSPRSVEQTHTVLHAALEEAIRQGQLFQNPCKYARPPRPLKKEMQTLSAGELERLITASATVTNEREEWHETKWAALWTVLGTAGLRLGEALGLKWEDIDLDKRIIRVQRALQRERQGDKRLIFVEPKSASSRRSVHIGRRATQALREHRVKQMKWRLQLGGAWQDEGLIFTSDAGGKVEPAYINRALNKALNKAGLKHIRVHDLRHTCASVNLAEGTPEKVVQEMLGHSSIALTIGTYSHVMPGMHQEAADRVDAALDRAAM